MIHPRGLIRRSRPLGVVSAVAVIGVAAVPSETARATSGGPADRAPTCEPVPMPSVVRREGDPAPGTDAVFQGFDRPNVGPDGRVCFTADTDGPAAEDDVIYVGDQLVAQEGAVAPGTGGATYGTFTTFETLQQVNAVGQVAYLAGLRDAPGGATFGLFRAGLAVVLEGDAAPGIGGRVIQDLSFVGIADDGALGFLADLDGPGGDDSVLYLDGQPIYRQGSPVPLLPEETWDGNFDEVQWNARGDLLFEGNTSLPTSGDIVLFRRLRSGEEAIVAREGQTVSARDGLDMLDTIAQSALADDGAWALRGTLGLAPADADGIVLDANGLVAQEGDPVPELTGVVLGAITALDANARGDVLYLADLAGAPEGVDEGIFVNGCLLLTDGEPAPGLPQGTVFVDLGFEDLSINDEREVAFAAAYGGAQSGDGIFRLVLPLDCIGDLDDSGSVDFSDVIRVLVAWGACPPGERCPEDLDGDGQVDADDVLIVLVRWGPCGG